MGSVGVAPVALGGIALADGQHDTFLLYPQPTELQAAASELLSNSPPFG
ncbi:MAG: hypothetical protein JO110_12885 [Acetobacteraceae bacterium]|nr:hypothetical protein [Acetobacteraceae bacterium]